MSDIIKRNWLIIVITLVTFAVNGGLIAMAFAMGGKVEAQQAALDNKQKEIEAMKRYPYAMTEENKQLALRNAATAWDNYNKAFDQIVAKYEIAKHNESLARVPAEVARFVRTACRNMDGDLRGNKRIEFGGGVEHFTFEKIRTTTDLPPLDDVPFIVKNVIIVEAIVEVLSSCGITHLLEFKRDELKVKDSGDVYKYLTFNLTVKGNFDAIRRCVNGLHNAKFLFIVRKVDMKADDMIGSIGQSSAAGTGTMPGEGPAGTGVGVQGDGSKQSRIAFKKMAAVSAKIEFDYIELVRKSETGN